jgi:hypothetical protein
VEGRRLRRQRRRTERRGGIRNVTKKEKKNKN